MYKYLLIILLTTGSALAGPYLELGLGVPLFPNAGYIPDMYGIASFGYNHKIDSTLSFDVALSHRSLTGLGTRESKKHCGGGECYGDNSVETKLRISF